MSDEEIRRLLPGVTVCQDDDGLQLTAVSRRPTAAECSAIIIYRQAYQSTFQKMPRGLHYIADVGPVWLPPQ